MARRNHSRALERNLERAAAEWGEAFTPPLILRRLVAQGRLGVKSGQGFFPYPRPDAGFADGPVKLETRGFSNCGSTYPPPDVGAGHPN